MLGSSKSLLRALNSVLENWKEDDSWLSSPSTEIKDLYIVIDAYNKKHNSLSSISTTLNESLRSTYENYIEKSESLSKEIFYLEILTRLSPSLNAAQIKSSLQTYLRPALDSAGYDLVFVEKARSFFKSVALAPMGSDEAVSHQRTLNSSMVTESILKIYLKDPETQKIMGMYTPEKERDTEAYEERMRFVLENASDFLNDWGLQMPREYFNLLDQHFCIVASRQKVLVLLCQILSSNVSQLRVIMDTPLFSNVLRCLLFDFSECILSGALFALLMLLGKVCNRLSEYLPELLVIFGRLSTWRKYEKFLEHRETALAKYLAMSNTPWSIAYSDNESPIVQTALNKDGEFDLSYLLSILYGLYPSNILRFTKSPGAYLRDTSPSILSLEFVIELEETLQFTHFAYVSQNAKSLLRRVMLHPNIINGISIEEEIEEPIRWILVENSGEDVTEEDVISACLRLNPDIFLSFPDYIVSTKSVIRQFSSTNKGHEPNRKEPFFHKDKSHVSTTLPNSARHSIASSNSEKSSFGLKLELPAQWQNLDRKLSIVPTDLVIEPDVGEVAKEESTGIQFNKVHFNGQSTRNSNGDGEDTTKEDALSPLFMSHEKLYTGNAPSNTNMPINMDNNFAVGSFQTVSKSASNLLTEQLKCEGSQNKPNKDSSEISSVEEKRPASRSEKTIEFYQRELLLMKNEMEFTSYMKHLNKYSYLKLKLKLNRIVHELSKKPSLEETVPVKAYNDLLDTLKHSEIRNVQALEHKDEEVAKLLGRLDEIQSRCEDLQRRLSESESELTNSRSMIQKIQRDCSIHEAEVKDLRVKIRNLLDCNDSNGKVETSEREELPESSKVFVDVSEKKIFDLQRELDFLKEHNQRFASELQNSRQMLDDGEKRYKKEMELVKLDLGEQLRKSAGSYERKIQELNLVIAKLEASLEERNSHIIQLSTSKPIRIPTVSASNSVEEQRTRPEVSAANVTQDYFNRGHEDSANTSSASTPSGNFANKHSSRQSSTQSFPTIKGRGGYQKRVKKVM
ncbi:putative tuberous sclerosis protein [Clavispora lusitaniae]|uniref:Tuberous sclerosis protein n=1 Tax=Clavispora lusitaniae TaxID=36911 RepID=A0ACD0WL30_CLALS|nr:hypothetical protein E0198_003144 [Clavispora lusitaniae]KAF7582646.1 Hamartin family protein [Clavispora lusitaniae]QFZ28274.1 putative tuberous sclerosis protein [Clavispora lusitaniae]QFZ33937.1 putative tuberous sclerosis protein [Clavispora lusitaniae]QFZ39621.1 putative tuberous sclerosis protein [Clavispora lusitaniae]